MSDHLSANVARFSGFAALYDTMRPPPPQAIVDLLCQLARTPRPALVVDLGSGTGLSTRIWASRAEHVVGVEPSADMRGQAEAHGAATANVRFQAGFAHATGLPDACADIVTISQALHWMAPAPTFAEVARILRPGGIFAAYDCDWPPTCDWEAEQAYLDCLTHARTLEAALMTSPGVRSWDKQQHGENMRASSQFRHVKEIALHQVESGNATRLVGIARSQGQVATLLKHGLSEDEIGITALRTAAQRVLGDTEAPWYWTYRVRIGVK